MSQSIAQSLRGNPYIEIDSAAEEVCISEHCDVKQSITTYIFEDNSVLVMNPWGVLYNS